MSSGDDVIFLKGGGFVRGSVIEVIPDKGARIHLITGEVSSIPWASIDRVVTGGAQPPIGPEPTPAPPTEVRPLPATPPQPAPPARPTTRLHVDGPLGLEIAAYADADGWKWVCESPCDAVVPIDGRFEVRGPGVRTSSSFSLRDDGSGSTTIRVSKGSTGALVVGYVGWFGGGLVALTGGTLILVGLVMNASASSPASGGAPNASSSGNTFVAVGAVVIGVGVAGVIAGAILSFSNFSTTVTQVAPTAIEESRWIPAPTFHVAREPAADATRIQIPILSGRF